MKLQRYTLSAHEDFLRRELYVARREDQSGEYYRADDVDALLAKLRGLTCKAEGWEADEDIIVVHGVGIVGGSLSRRNSGAVERWFNGAMAEIMERLMGGGE